LLERALPDAAIPGQVLAKGPNERIRLDYGPDFSTGIISKVLPVVLPETYRVLVPKVDVDGNETSGIRLPDVAVPLGTATGWNVRAPEAGAAGALCYLQGSFIPFARTKAEREANKDPRLSVEERYKDHADYTERVKQAAAALQRQGYLLEEDVTRIVDKASALPW
jgi:hypothetical protein